MYLNFTVKVRGYLRKRLNKMVENEIIPPVFDEQYMLDLIRARMPFGKYKDVLLVDLPETYIMWFARKGFPKGKLGGMLQSLYEIKLNGLDYLLKPLRK